MTAPRRRAPLEAQLRVGVLAETTTAGERLAGILERRGIHVVSRPTAPKELPEPGGATGHDALLVASDRAGDRRSSQLSLLAERFPDVPVVVVASSASPREIRHALAAGAAGFVVDDRVEGDAGLGERLAATVRAVCAGQLAVPAGFREAVARPRLSSREKQILGMVVMGFANREIAGKLFISEATVKSHLSSAFAKLGVHSRGEATDLILDSDRGLGTGILAISAEAPQAVGDER